MNGIYKKSSEGMDGVAARMKEHVFSPRRVESRIALPDVEIEINLIAGHAIDMLPPAVLRVVDMSAKGIRLECMLQYPLPEGERLNIYFYKPSRLNGIRVLGAVRYCNSTINRSSYGEPSIYHVGCEFIFPNADTRTRFSSWAETELVKYIDRRTPFFQDLFNMLTLKENSKWHFDSVRSMDELKAAFELAQSEYWDQQSADKKILKNFFNFHMLLPRSKTFIALNKDDVVQGAITLIEDSKQYGVPCEKYFEEEISSAREEGRKVGEVGMLATRKKLFSTGKFSLGSIRKTRFLFQLFRIMFLHARENSGLDDIFIMVHPKQAEFYKYLYFSQESSGAKLDDDGTPVVLMRLDIHKAAAMSYVENKPLYNFFFPQMSNDSSFVPALGIRHSDLQEIIRKNDPFKTITDRQMKILSVLHGSFQEIPLRRNPDTLLNS